MKLLAVDVGNSEIKQATVDNGIVGTVKRDSTRDIDAIAAGIAESDLPVALCSVRKLASEKIKYALAQNEKTAVFEISFQTSEPVSGFYESMGADRVAEVSAAWADYEGKRPVAVIGMGTATTITTASREGRFTGGFITLGLGAVCADLTDALPELPAVDPQEAKSLEPGFDVYSSICRGTVAAHVGIVEKWISIFKNQLGDDLAVVATGGWSKLLAPYCQSVDKIDANLTMRGIWTIFQRSEKYSA